LVIQNQGVQIISLFVVYFWCWRSVTLSLSCGNGLLRTFLENWFKQFEQIVYHNLRLLSCLRWGRLLYSEQLLRSEANLSTWRLF
jgi:hypothetical protein